jgi:acetyl-CoA/propionyl-CoA carboxylase biotin carboxyl carrier protein
VIKRVLIANRGEIAVRIVRACRELGVESVAVYSDADAKALHVRVADRAVRIGPAPAADSYLSVPALIVAARRAEADAIHPGYGFLSERSELARACEAAAIVFVGPPADVIERMGSKIGARDLMRAAGVPIVPGETPRDQSDEGVLAAAQSLGFPALIKASAGGGGKGMRTVRNETDGRELVAAARREAEAAFGDGTLYVERLIQRARHIEIQVFADSHGNVVHVFERECSLQRRHQKVVEESPSLAVTPALRASMGTAAVAAARAAGYRNAGTIEFLVEGRGDTARFYFLEMNTRLQVEHPVTELVAGVDLVRAQLLVAAGERLPWTQADLTQRGHAIECRVYAEDPGAGFLPQAGPLLVYREPAGPGIRVDSGVTEGDVVGVNYDPLLSKLIAFGENREAAITRVIAALRAYPILGIRSNIPFLVRLLEHTSFRTGDVHTGLIDEIQAELTHEADVPAEVLAAAAVASPATPRSAISQDSAAPADPWDTIERWGRWL